MDIGSNRKIVCTTLFNDVDKIAQDLINAFNLTFEEQAQNLSDPLIRWFDFRLRYIEPRSRKILKSNNFDKRLPEEAASALRAFTQLSENGADLNPYQTKKIKRNDSSGTKRQLRTDGLWADWRIHHAHLTEAPVGSGQEFSDRSEWLLFFLTSPDVLALIDVRSHNEPGIFQSIDLVEHALRSWPDFANSMQAKGIVGLASSSASDTKSVKELRTGGVNQMLVVDGVVYAPPGGGLTTAATSTQVSLTRNRVKSLARDIQFFLLELKANRQRQPWRKA
jgi:hypothetical protein